jgi:hypothetical protein
MPKPLREPQPTSSVARLLDLDAAARALAKHPMQEGAQVRPNSARFTFSDSQSASLAGETPRVKRELVLTHSADEALTRLVELYRRATGTRLTTSHIARAMLMAVTHCFDQLEKHAKKIGGMKLPSNARGREFERERFEARIADAFVEGIRTSTAMDGDELD